MLKLNQLLNRFKNLTNTDKEKKQLIMEIILNKKIPININQIFIKKNTILFKTQPIIKTEILFKKEEILKDIRKIQGLQITSTIL
ncbi:MAG: hypothetical protein WAV98_03025 [Minisyncoccia bacterium]